jgi:hypothetical protein
MNVRNVMLTLLACLLSAFVAVALFERLTTWLLEESGVEGRTVIALASAPWFGQAAAFPPEASTPPVPIRGRSVGPHPQR